MEGKTNGKTSMVRIDRMKQAIVPQAVALAFTRKNSRA